MKTYNYPVFCSIGQIIDTSQVDCKPRSLEIIDFYLASNQTNKDNAKSVGKEAENTQCYFAIRSFYTVTVCPN